MYRFSKLHFTGQKNGEDILIAIRRHWFNILAQFIPILLLIAALIGSYLYLPLLFPAFNGPTFHGFFLFMESLMAMFVLVAVFLIWVDYYLDTWIVTTQRIVNIEQKGLFCRVISELELDKIQDITTEITGVLPTFFNYGNVFVQTAAEKERFIFRKVPDPYKIKDALMSLQKDKKREKMAEFQQMFREA